MGYRALEEAVSMLNRYGREVARRVRGNRGEDPPLNPYFPIFRKSPRNNGESSRRFIVEWCVWAVGQG